MNRVKAVLPWVMVALLLLAILPIYTSPQASAEPVSKTRYISDIAYPAVVLIYSKVTGIVVVPTTQGPLKVQSEVGALGSGFFVNPQGYLVTNGHVVWALKSSDPSQDPWVLEDLKTQAALIYIRSLVRQGYQVSNYQAQQIIQYFVQYGEVREVSVDVYVILGEVKGADIEAKGIKARIVGKPSPFLEKDIAILKVDLENTPALLLADSSKVKVGDRIYAIGYPGVVTFHPMLNPSTLLVPSVTSGIISAFRETVSNTPAFQTDAATTHGNSGGPALNEEGFVVGIVNMGSIDPERGIEVAGFNFLIPSNIARDFLREYGVKNYQGIVDKEYKKALALYYAGLYASAIKEFESLLRIFPYHWYAKKLIKECQVAISKGERAKTSLSLSAPSKIRAGEEITVSGKLDIASAKGLPIALKYDFSKLEVVITYRDPDGKTFQHTVQLRGDGTFEDRAKLDKPGDWAIEVAWKGSDDLAPAKDTAKVSVEATGPPLSLIAGLGVVAVVAVVAILLILRKRRARARPAYPYYYQQPYYQQ